MVEVEKIWLTNEAVHVKLVDGQLGQERFADYPRLRHATPEQRARYVADSFGIHWPELDEDLEIEGFFREKDRGELYRIFIEHPELNASAVARRLGFSHSLLAQYISGAKRPSDARLREIIACIRQIGADLSSIPMP